MTENGGKQYEKGFYVHLRHPAGAAPGALRLRFAEAAEDEARIAELQALMEEGKDFFFGTNGKTSDPEAALPYFQKAAEGGVAEAWYYVGHILIMRTVLWPLMVADGR